MSADDKPAAGENGKGLVRCYQLASNFAQGARSLVAFGLGSTPSLRRERHAQASSMVEQHDQDDQWNWDAE